MSDPFAALSQSAREKLSAGRRPHSARPMLATLCHEPFSREDWIYERKLDGVRCIVFREQARVRLVSRNDKDVTSTWPELAAACKRQRHDDFVVDGEIVAFEGERTSFARLQKRLGVEHPDARLQHRIAAYLYLFDILYLNGCDTTTLALRERKKLLKRTIQFAGRLRYTPHENEHGKQLLEEACAKGWEGLIAKDASAPYEHARSRRWLKLKCVHRQELVIGGFTEPSGSRRGFGALLVGYYDDGELRYAGKVGTGYDEETLNSLGSRLRRLERSESPFCAQVSESGAHWTKPQLAGEFGFTEWTRDGKLRHPRFVGLRRDKSPHEVVRESTAQ